MSWTLRVVNVHGEAATSMLGTSRVLIDALSVGRGATVDWVLPDTRVSREHARFEASSAGVAVTPAGSGPVFVGGKAIEGPTLLADLDLVQLGPVLLRVFADPKPTLSVCLTPRVQETLVKTLDPIFELQPGAADRLFEQTFPCGDGPHGTTWCATEQPPPAGDWVFLANEFAAPIDVGEPGSFTQHAFVFETNGDAGDDYVPSPSFPGDFFAGTDLWYELLHDPVDGTRVRVIDVGAGFAEVPSQARFVVMGHQLGFFVPASELERGTVPPTFRTSAFWHTGDYGLGGGPWSGSFHPPLDEPLLDVAVDVRFQLTD